MEMTKQFFHEQRYRTTQQMELLRNYPVTVCGAGALGANLLETLARSGYGTLKVIDSDRIETRNLSTQPYYQSDVGAYKGKVLANTIYRAVGTTVEVIAKRLTASNAKSLLRGSTMVIDVFDNSGSCQVVKDYCLQYDIPCLHAGLAKDYAEVVWEPEYRVPSATNDDICDYPLARNLVLLTVAVASETATQFITEGIQKSCTITLQDFSIQAYA